MRVRFKAPAISRWRKSRTFLNVAVTMWRLLESVTEVKLFLSRPGIAGIIADIAKVSPKLLAEVLRHLEDTYNVGTPDAGTELPQLLKRVLAALHWATRHVLGKFLRRLQLFFCFCEGCSHCFVSAKPRGRV